MNLNSPNIEESMKKFPAFLFALIGLTAISLSSPSFAQNLRFTPQDDLNMTACLEEAINDEERNNCIGSAARQCFEEPDGYTTLGTTECYLREETWWDQKLNESYADLRQRLSDDLFNALKEAQIAWIAYRDAKCDFAYKFYGDGTIRHILFSNCKLHTTAARANELSAILLDWMG